MKGQVQTQKYGFTVNFSPKKYFDPARFLPKNMGDNFFDSKNLFLWYYIIEPRDNGSC